MTPSKRAIHYYRKLSDNIIQFSIDSKLINGYQFVENNKIQQINQIYVKQYTTNKMSSDDSKCDTNNVDGIATGAHDVEMNDVLANVKTAVRNVQTQHGDFRTVDEENIVVLRNCPSPLPVAASTSLLDDDGNEIDKDAADVEAEQVVWIEPFSGVSI